MKYVLNLFFKNGDHMAHMFHELRSHGFNGTVFATTSLKHALDGEENHERHFVNLAHLEMAKMEETTFAVFVVEGERLEELKAIVREETGNFQDMKGGMYSHPAEDFEGSI